MPFMYNELLTSESGGVEWCGGTDDVLVAEVWFAFHIFAVIFLDAFERLGCPKDLILCGPKIVCRSTTIA